MCLPMLTVAFVCIFAASEPSLVAAFGASNEVRRLIDAHSGSRSLGRPNYVERARLLRCSDSCYVVQHHRECCWLDDIPFAGVVADLSDERDDFKLKDVCALADLMLEGGLPFPPGCAHQKGEDMMVPRIWEADSFGRRDSAAGGSGIVRKVFDIAETVNVTVDDKGAAEAEPAAEGALSRAGDVRIWTVTPSRAVVNNINVTVQGDFQQPPVVYEAMKVELEKNSLLNRIKERHWEAEALGIPPRPSDASGLKDLAEDMARLSPQREQLTLKSAMQPS